jgi:hypothetical protein
MSRGIASALTVLRVTRGQPAPTDGEARAALARDRAQLGLPTEQYLRDVQVAGPYAISIDGQDLDEYVIWER